MNKGKGRGDIESQVVNASLLGTQRVLGEMGFLLFMTDRLIQGLFSQSTWFLRTSMTVSVVYLGVTGDVMYFPFRGLKRKTHSHHCWMSIVVQLRGKSG